MKPSLLSKTLTKALNSASSSNAFTTVHSHQFRLLPLVVACCCVQQAQAIGLAGIISEAVKSYPTITQAQIAVQSAEAQTKQYKLQHMPVFGVQATQSTSSGASDTTSNSNFFGTLNLYSGGAIEEQVRMSKFNEQYQSYKVDETAEELAYSIAQTYLSGLTTREQMASAQENFNRHQKIIDDLKIITQYDHGRWADLIQAQSRQLQVKTRILQLESDLRTSENKLSKYLPAGEKIEWLPLDNIEKINTDYSQHPSLLAQYAEEERAESQALYTKKARRPKLDLQMVEGGYKNVSGGADRGVNLVVGWNFFDLSKGVGQEVADNDLRAARAKTEDVRRSIDERVNTAKIEADRALITANGAKDQVKAARSVADAYEQQYMIARRSILDVLNAYSEWSNLESAVVTAKSVYRQALISGKYAAGQLVQWAMHPPAPDANANTANSPEKVAPIDARSSRFGVGEMPKTEQTSSGIMQQMPASSASSKTAIIYPNVQEPIHKQAKQSLTPKTTATSPAPTPNTAKIGVTQMPATTYKPPKASSSIPAVKPEVIYPNIDEPKIVPKKKAAEKIDKDSIPKPPVSAANVLAEPIVYPNVTEPLAKTRVTTTRVEKPVATIVKPQTTTGYQKIVFPKATVVPNAALLSQQNTQTVTAPAVSASRFTVTTPFSSVTMPNLPKADVVKSTTNSTVNGASAVVDSSRFQIQSIAPSTTNP